MLRLNMLYTILVTFLAVAGIGGPINTAKAFDLFGFEAASKNVSSAADALSRIMVDESGKWRGEVNEVKKSLDRLPAGLKDHFSPMLERTVKGTGTEARATIQFIVDRMRQNARVLLALGDVANSGGKPEKVTTAFKALGEALTPPDPSPIGSEAGQVEIEYTTPLDFQAKRKLLVLHGYDFRQKGERGEKWKVEILDKNKTILRDVTEHLSISSPYEMGVNTSKTGVAFRPGDHSFRFSWAEKVLSEVPITWGEPLESLKKLKPEVYTVRSNGRKAFVYDCGHFYWFESELGMKDHVMKNTIVITPNGGDFKFQGLAARFEPSGDISWPGNVWIKDK
jgi:hypothetical protein